VISLLTKEPSIQPPHYNGEELLRRALRAKRHEVTCKNPETGAKVRFRVNLPEDLTEGAMVSIFFKRSDLPDEIGKTLEKVRDCLFLQCDRTVSIYWCASTNDEKLVMLHINKAVRKAIKSSDTKFYCRSESSDEHIKLSEKQVKLIIERVKNTDDIKYLLKAVIILFEAIESSLIENS
jgi:hypothetical protein